MNIWQNARLLAIISAVCAAIFQSMDNITMHNYVKIESDSLATLCFLAYGAWNSFFVGLLLTPFFGRRLIDPDYRGLSLGTKTMRREARYAGVLISISALGYIGASRIADPSIVCALSTLVLINTALIDTFRRYIDWRKMMIPILLAMFGGMLAAYTGHWQVTLWSFILIVIVSNVPWAFVEFAEQRGAKEMDSANFFLWRGFFLAQSCTVIAVILALSMGELKTLVRGWQGLLRYELWIALTMVFVWLSIGLKMTAKKIESVSAVMIVRSIEIVFTYPIIWIGTIIDPNAFGEPPKDVWTWVIRLIGAFCIIIAIGLIPKKQERDQKKTL